MNALKAALFGSCLVFAASAAQADAVKLDDQQLDRVSAGTFGPVLGNLRTAKSLVIGGVYGAKSTIFGSVDGVESNIGRGLSMTMGSLPSIPGFDDLFGNNVE